MNTSTILRNILAIVLGLVIGGLVNMCILMIGTSIIPPPEGADLTNPEGLKASMHLMQPKHFAMPFLAHAIGTFVGAWIAAKIAASYKMRFALAIGMFFLVGGIVMVVMVPSPIWFTLLDLIVAYIPMACLAGKMGSKIMPST